MGRLEEREADLDPVIVYAMPEDIDRPPLIELLGQPLAELLKDAVRPAMDLEEALPGCRLGRRDEGDQFRGIQAHLRVEVVRPLGLRPPLADPVTARLDE